ncbi:MAG: hypothetical protein M1831_005491 [Alyxoria varia]|nr:MAG: hypothetical protein M1831_005491 [Alyxoria varia]
MVGGRFSRGCKTCKSRKIKCDEQQPACLNCRIGNRNCEGLTSPFVHHTNVLPTSESRFPIVGGRRSTASPAESSGSSSGRSSSKPTSSTGPSQPPARVSGWKHYVEAPLAQSTEQVPRVVLSDGEKLSQRMQLAISATKQDAFSMWNFGAYIQEIPVRIGQNASLDSASECLLYAHQRWWQPTAPWDRASQLRRYGTALQSLKIDLDNAGTGQASAETLCAALVLCAYEFLNVEDDVPAWVSHAGGAMTIIQAWGPERITTNFERLVYIAQAPSIILKSILSNTSCFLDTPQWRRIITDHSTPPGCTTLEARTIPIYATLPAILRDVRAVISQTANTTSFTSAGAEGFLVLARAQEFRHRLLSLDPLAAELLNDPTLVVEEPANPRIDPSSPYGTVYNFSDLDVAQALCYHWRLVLIINRVIARLVSVLEPSSSSSVNDPFKPIPTSDSAADQLLRQDQRAMDKESLHAARNIGMSLPAARRVKPLGSLFALFSVGVAADALETLSREGFSSSSSFRSRFEAVDDAVDSDAEGVLEDEEGDSGMEALRLKAESVWMRGVLDELLEPFGSRGRWFQTFYENAIAL